MRQATNTFLLLVLVFTAAPGCSDLLLGTEVDNRPLALFNEVWTEVDQHYSLFSSRDVDWNEVRSRYGARITADASDQMLFDAMCEMLMELEDGHVNLYAGERGDRCAYDGWYSQYRHNFDWDLVVAHAGAPLQTAESGEYAYARLDDGTGYLYVGTFRDSGWLEHVDTVFRALAPLERLVVDVRDNGGGNSAVADGLAGRFADRRRLYSFIRYRDGPEHDDFTERIPRYVEPAGDERFEGPVAVLTNRRCFSACESFVLAARILPNVSVVGDTTGGGLGAPVFRELPNGWSFRIPVWVQTGPGDEQLERVGIAPDLHVELAPTDFYRGHDTILQTALDELKGR